jgi:hypothetical protein
MGLNRDKFRKIVGGITTATEPQEATAQEETPLPAQAATPQTPAPPAGQGRESAEANAGSDQDRPGESRRFAKRGRPKGRKDGVTTGKAHKVKVSLFLDEQIINDLYEWAHADKIHPGEMFERALKPFHEKEAKRRNAGKG